MEHTIPRQLPLDECLDIGTDALTGVNDSDDQAPFTFAGKLNHATRSLDPPKLTLEDIKKLDQARQYRHPGRRRGDLRTLRRA